MFLNCFFFWKIYIIPFSYEINENKRKILLSIGKNLIFHEFPIDQSFNEYCFTNEFFFSEIGAVLLNVDTGNVEDQFHHYVRPTKIPKLSSFCIGLTGITQTMVDNGEPFPSVFPKFQNWIEKVQSEKNLRFTTPMERRATPDGPNVSFCSWSNFDLEFYFKLECQRTNINISPHFKAWIDARKLYDVSLFRNVYFQQQFYLLTSCNILKLPFFLFIAKIWKWKMPFCRCCQTC